MKKLVFLFYTLISLCQAQTQNQDQTLTLDEQRAIMIFNFSEQVKWRKINSITTFKIGILATDNIAKNLSKIAANRRIYDKRIVVERINSIQDIKNFNVVYLNITYEYLLKPLLESTKGNQILVITEGFPADSSMINMVLVADEYSYDINREYIREADLKITSLLAQKAVTSTELKDKLFKKAEQNLYLVNRENNEQKKVIEKQIKTIGNQKEAITLKDEALVAKEFSLKNLYKDGERKDRELLEKISLEKAYEHRIVEQVNEIDFQKRKIDSVNIEIQNQQKILEYQTASINKKTAILAKKNTIINTQRRQNIILSILSTLLFILSLFLLLAYLKNKKLNVRLQAQHIEINDQSKLLTSKNKELEQFAYITSHDLQEPLNTISSFIDIVKMEYENKFDDEGKQMLDFIKEGSVRMKKLIDALLQYSRLGRSQDFQEVHCMSMLDILKVDLQTFISNAEAELNYHDLPTIKGNELELRLLFQNLITNGIKFRHPNIKPKIDISCKKVNDIDEGTKKEQDFWMFSVTDNGIGIEKEYQDRVFAIFQRLHSRLEYEGSGIGLAHCKKIVEAHSGKIWFDSEKGSGTTFCFSIPA